MKFFKSKNKNKNKAPLNTDKPESLHDHKSLLSASPSESGILNNKNAIQAISPEGISLVQAQSDHKSMEEPAVLRPHSAFDYVPRIDAPEDEPEASLVLVTGVNLVEKKPMKIELPALEGKSLKFPIHTSSERPNIEKVVTKSRGELGPEDVEINENDQEKSSKIATMKLDMNPFSEKRRPKEYFYESRKLSDHKPASESKSPEDAGYDLDRSKQLNESHPLTGLLDSPPLEGGIMEARSIPVMQDGKKLLADKKDKERDKKSLSVSFVDQKEPDSVLIHRAVSEQPMLDEVNSAVLPARTTRPKSKKWSWKNTVFFRKKSNMDNRPKIAFKVPMLAGIVIYIALVYIGMPFGMFFGAYGYKDNMIKAVLNFGLLGFFQGIVQAVLLYQLIDLPIRTKIREIEGRNRGLINPSKYLVINKLNTLAMLGVSTGLQIAAGVTMYNMKQEVTGTKILISCLATTAIKGILWLGWIWIKSPRTLKNEKKILDSELKEIGQIRKDFMADLYDTRKKMEIRSINQNILPGSQLVTTAYLGISSNVVSNVDVDARKLLHKVYDFSSDFKRIRLKSIKTFLILMLSLSQILIMIHIIRLTETTTDVAQSLACVILLFIVGSIFGFLDLFHNSTKPVLNTMKLVSLIVTAGSYRFLFLDLSSEDKMLGAAIIKLVYKTVLYFFGVLFGEKIVKKVIRDKKHSIITELYESVQEKEASHIKHPIYVFLKFTMLQEIDLFFAVVLLYLTAGASDWLGSSDLRFGVKVRYNFYMTVVLIEIGVHFVVGVVFTLMTNKILKMRARTIEINLRKEFISAMMKNKWVIIGFKGLLLFVLMFIFFNDV